MLGNVVCQVERFEDRRCSKKVVTNEKSLANGAVIYIYSDLNKSISLKSLFITKLVKIDRYLFSILNLLYR